METPTEKSNSSHPQTSREFSWTQARGQRLSVPLIHTQTHCTSNCCRQWPTYCTDIQPMSSSSTAHSLHDGLFINPWIQALLIKVGQHCFEGWLGGGVGCLYFMYIQRSHAVTLLCLREDEKWDVDGTCFLSQRLNRRAKQETGIQSIPVGKVSPHSNLHTFIFSHFQCHRVRRSQSQQSPGTDEVFTFTSLVNSLVQISTPWPLSSAV